MECFQATHCFAFRSRKTSHSFDDRAENLRTRDAIRRGVILSSPLYDITHPDPRNTLFGLVDSAGQVRPQELSDHLEAIQRYVPKNPAPESVTRHFKTANNLYAYAWFVYRFYAVAEQQALSSLEFALRSRLESKSDSPIARRSKRFTGLSSRLREAQKLGLIANSRLRIRDQLARERARACFEFDQIKKCPSWESPA